EVAPCSLFDPESVELPESSGLEVPADIAVQMRMQEVVTDVEDDFLDDPFVEVTDQREVTVDGHTAYRQEQRHSGEGFHPEGMRTVRYVVDLGDRALLAMSHDVGQPDFDTKIEVLDEMLPRIRFDSTDTTDSTEGADREPPEVEGAWETLSGAPIEARLNSSATWSGDRLFVWGGGDAEGVEADGAVFDPSTQGWSTVPAAPIEPRWGHHAFWAGDRLLVWGGTAGPDHLAECFTDGALYDPASSTWEAIPPAPGADQRCGASAVWTDDELVVFGGYDDTGPPTPGSVLGDGAAFDPDTGEWRSIPSAPVEPRYSADAVWTGREVIVVGGTGDAGPDEVGSPLGDGAAYDPGSDQWRTIASWPLEPRTGAAAVWSGDEMVVVGGREVDVEDGGTQDFDDGAAYDPRADTWRSIADHPGDPRVDASVARGDQVIYLIGGDSVGDGAGDAPDDLSIHAMAWDPETDQWYELPDPPGTPRTNHTATWTGDELLVWGGQVRIDEPDPDVPFVVWGN
ncbi:MAG: kelch repeat-containing protein, partial [Acidimicrobiales bacterium]